MVYDGGPQMKVWIQFFDPLNEGPSYVSDWRCADPDCSCTFDDPGVTEALDSLMEILEEKE